MQQQEIKDLIKRYNAGTCTNYEKALVEDWYLQLKVAEPNDLSEQDGLADLDMIWTRLPVHQEKVRKMRMIYRVAAAAVVLVFLSVGGYFLMNRAPDQEKVIIALSHNLKPGGNKALLTLSNGRQIALAGAQNGQLTTQHHTAIIKTADGKLAYKAAANNNDDALNYNTLTTPMGGIYTVTLSDGTKVTLDAGSSIRYPVSFKGNERRVEITGQAYFEVAHDKSKPFRVTSGTQTVEVLGTHFNINAYADESTIKTTLLEGSVKVTRGDRSGILVPGQQSVTGAGNAAIVIHDVDPDEAVAWKDGLFRFKRAGLQTVMRQFARWYNVEVVYENGVPDVAITGKVSRSADAEQVLKIVNSLGIRFKMDGKKIIVINE